MTRNYLLPLKQSGMICTIERLLLREDVYKRQFADNDQQVNGESLFLQYYNQVIHFSGEHRMDDRVIEDVLVPLIYRCVAK